MKATKRIIICLLLFVCCFVPGEVYQYYLDICDQFPYTDFYVQPELPLNRMLDDIGTEAARHGVQVFKLHKTADSAFRSTLTLYTDADTRRILETAYALKEGTFSGIFSGSTEIRYEPFGSVSSEIQEENPMYQFLGETEAIHACKQSLINRYGGGFPAENSYDAMQQTTGLLAAVWILMILSGCLLTLYDVMLLKKEHFVRITMGERIGMIYLRYTVFDLLFFAAAFTGFAGCADLFYGISFRFSFTAGCFLVFCAVNLLAALPILTIEPKSALTNDFSSGRLLAYSYAVKACTIVLCALLMSAGGEKIAECLRFYRQKPVYEEYADYRMISRFSEDPSVQMHRDPQDGLYEAFCGDADIIYDFKCIAFGEDDAETAVIMNRNALPLLLRGIPELAQTDFADALYVILPDDKELRAEDRADFSGMAEDVRFLTYRQRASVFTFLSGNARSENYAVSELAENPVILFRGTDQAEASVSLLHCFMKPSAGMDAVIRDAGYICVWTSMAELFAHHWTVLSRTLFLNLTICAILMILQILVLGCILRLEYSFHAQENAVKKILGYTVLQKFRRQILVSLLLYLVCGIAAVKLSARMQSGSVLTAGAAVLLTCAADFLFFLLLIRHYEKSSIPRTLKGGAL